MVEYHVNSCRLFQDQMNKHTQFGGNLSVRRDPTSAPLLIFGHDECIFKQYTLSKKSWTGPSGETVLVPKVIDRG
jgi:hypothetical protein